MAGGFYRARRMLESFRRFSVQAIKNDSFELGIPAISYPARALYLSGAGVLFRVARLVNWVWSTVCVTILGLLRLKRPDAVYVPISELLPLTMSGWAIARIRGIPLILCNLNVRDTELWPINRALHKRADGIITISQALVRELRAEGIVAPIVVGTLGVDDRHVKRYPQAAYCGVFVGRHTPAKGIYDLLTIWRLVCDELPNAKLVTAGAFSMKAPDVMERAKRLQLERNVEFHGTVSDAEKWQLYADSRLCVFPSFTEGWGIVPIEAHLAGLPVVAYDLPAYQENIAHSPAASLVAAGDVQAFASRVVAWLRETPDARPAQDWARQFTWPAAAALEEDLLQKLITDANDCKPESLSS